MSFLSFNNTKFKFTAVAFVFINIKPGKTKSSQKLFSIVLTYKELLFIGLILIKCKRSTSEQKYLLEMVEKVFFRHRQLSSSRVPSAECFKKRMHE